MPGRWSTAHPLSLSLSLSLGCTLYLPLYADVRQSRLSRHTTAPAHQRHPRVRRRLWRRLLQRVASDIDDSSNSVFLLTRGHLWGAPTPLEEGAPHQCPLRVGSKLPLPSYADVRLHIPMTHHIDAGLHLRFKRMRLTLTSKTSRERQSLPRHPATTGQAERTLTLLR